MIRVYTIAWIPMVLLAILNGVLREKTYGRMMPQPRANQLSALSGILLFGAYTWLLGLRWPLHSSTEALAVGAIWLVLTVAFEFTFGHYVMHQPWRRLLSDYNLLAGRLWVLVLLAVALLPWLVFQIRS